MSTEQTIEGSLDIRWMNSEEQGATSKYALLFSRYKNFRSGAQRSKEIVGDAALKAYLIEIHFTALDATEWIKETKQRETVRIDNTMMPAKLLADYEAMTMQTDPAVFNPRLPVYTVTHIDRAAGIVTLSGSDGSSHQVRLDSWGPIREAQPVVGSKVQLLL